MQAHLLDDETLFDSMPWVTSLLPEKQIIEVVGQSFDDVDRFLLLSNQGASCATWPVQLRGSSVLLGTDPSRVRRVRWVSLGDYTKVFVLPTRAISPLHAAMLRRSIPDIPPGLQLMVTGDKVPLVQWQCNHGFVGVPETSLKRLK